MNGKKILITALALIIVTYGSQLYSQESVRVESLRGTTPIEDPSASPQHKRWLGKTALITRDFSEQPPLIPHKSQSQGQKINLKLNKCLSCHSLDEYEEAKATKISETHFLDREGNKLTDVSALRYFCTQCHVAQRDVAPLVDNEFKPSKDLQ